MENVTSYKILLATTFASAGGTAIACYRQAVKDSWKVWNVLTSDRAIATYRFIGRLILVAMGLAVMAGMATRKVWDRYAQPAIDAHVEQCLEAEPQAETKIEALAVKEPKQLAADTLDKPVEINRVTLRRTAIAAARNRAKANRLTTDQQAIAHLEVTA